MKRIPIFAFAAGMLIFASCSKETGATGADQAVSQLRTTSDDNEGPGDLNKTDFSYHLEKDPLTQEWLCPEPMDDCSRATLSCARMESLNTAIDNNTVQNYFSTRATASQFTLLDHVPLVKAGLAQGRFNIIREVNSNGDVFYMVVKNGTVNNGGHPRLEQVIHTVMVPKAVHQSR